MKVLSIREPFATLIMEKTKTIETRSWKTNYRGELYIHSCLSYSKSLNEKEASKLLKNDIQLGKILCRCILVDCIYMDEKYIGKIKIEDPINYKCGRYEVGRYAWILEDVEPLEKPIDTKGKLGIWNYSDGGIKNGNK